jgi:hypothetical protein
MQSWRVFTILPRPKILPVNPVFSKIYTDANAIRENDITDLYDRKITLGENNTRKQQAIDRVKASPARSSRV